MFLSNKVKSTKESVDDDKSKDIMDAESVNGELCTYLLTLITIIVYLLKSIHFKIELRNLKQSMYVYVPNY